MLGAHLMLSKAQHGQTSTGLTRIQSGRLGVCIAHMLMRQALVDDRDEPSVVTFDKDALR